MYQEFLTRFAKMSREIFGDLLTGVYLHGSLAMGCFHPAKSDLDLLLVVEGDIPVETKLAFLEQAVKFNEEAPQKGLELSVVKRRYCKPFVYPTPYELHFSPAHLERWRRDPQEYAEHFHGTDKDLAAHAAIVNCYGVPLYGPAVSEVFGEVSKEDYADSIWYDVGNAEEEILENPMYITLNLCRALAYLREDLVLSKETGGTWGLANVPGEYQGLIETALRCYESEADMVLDVSLAQAFARYMVDEIRGYRE